MEQDRQKYFDILTDGVDTLLKSSNLELWNRVHEVVDGGLIIFNKLKNNIHFKYRSTDHQENVLLALTFLLTKIVLNGNSKQKRLEGGARVHLQRARVQRPRTHKVHHRQNRPHAKTYKAQNRKWLVDQFEKSEAERKLLFFLSQPLEAASERTISDMSHGDKPNWGFCAIHIFLLLLKPLEFYEKLHIQHLSSRRSLPQIDSKNKSLTTLSLKTFSQARLPVLKTAEVVEVATQLADPYTAAAELLSVMEIHKGPSTAFINDRKCPSVKPVPLNGNLKFATEDVRILQVVDVLTWKNFSHGEFGCLMNYNTQGQLTIYPTLISGNRGRVRIPDRDGLEKTIVAVCHLHPHEVNRIFSPPSEADFQVFINNFLYYGIPYAFVFTPNGYFIISVQDNIANVIHKMLTDGTQGNLKNIHDLIKIQDLFIEPSILKKIDDETSALMDSCSDIPSGLILTGQNIVNLNIQTKNFGLIQMTTGYNFYFVSNEDLRQGKMIELPLIKQFSKSPSTGLTGSQLSSALAQTYGLGGDELSILTNKTHANQNLFYRAWTQLTDKEQQEYTVVISHKAKKIKNKKVFNRYRQQLTSLGLATTNKQAPIIFAQAFVNNSVLASALHNTATPEFLAEVGKTIQAERAASVSPSGNVISGGGGSILDKPGMITKMTFGDKVKETMFMNLPYPLNILKKYI